MKRFKKMMAIAIACAMIIGTMSFGMIGASAAEDSTIKVSGLAPGDTVNFYKIVEWVGEKDYDVSGWGVTDEFVSILTSDNLAKVIDSNETGYTGLTSELAGDLARGTSNAEPVNNEPIKVGTGEDSVEFNISSSGLGLYMAIITPADPDTVYNPVFVSADYDAGGNEHNIITSSASYANSGAAKKSTITLTKEFENEDDYNGDDGATAAVDDVLTFTVTTTIPGYGNTFDHPSFVLTDSLTDMELNGDEPSITVKAGNTELTGVDTGNVAEVTQDYIYTINPDKKSYTVTFSEAYLKKQKAPVEITVSYDAKILTATKIANINEKNNTVEVSYSHDPSTEAGGKPGGDKQYKKDITNHYTFSIDADNLFKTTGIIGESGSELFKISVDRNGNPIMSEREVYSNITETESEASPLAGASFKLYAIQKDENGEYKKESGKYVKGDEVGSATSDANGRIKFENLDAGKYILVEESAPTGYVKDTQEHVIDITAVIDDNVKITEYYDQNGEWYDEPGTGLTPYTYTTNVLESYTVKFDDVPVATHTFMHTSNDSAIKWSSTDSNEAPASIHNTKGVELPSTGGMGTTLFYIIGAILIIGAGVLLVTRRRTESAEE